MCLLILYILSGKTNQGALKKMSLSSKEIEDGEDEMSEDKDNGSRDEVVIPQKNSRKVTTAPGNKVGGKKSLGPMFTEELISHCRKGATWTKLPKDRRSAKLDNREKRTENSEEDEDSEKEALYSTWAKGRRALPVGVEEDEQDDDEDKGCEEEEEEGQNDLNQVGQEVASVQECEFFGQPLGKDCCISLMNLKNFLINL
nr:nucleolin-like isoform X4 [Equus asinus]